MASVEYQIYAERKPVLKTVVGTALPWRKVPGGFQLELAGNLLSILGPCPVEADDLPDEVAELHRPFSYMVSVEIADAAEDADVRKGIDTALALASVACARYAGVSYSLDSGTLDPPPLPGKPVRKSGSRKQLCDLLELSFFFQRRQTASGLKSFFKLLDGLLPEAQVHRYGTVEPPQYSVQNAGFQPLYEILSSDGFPVLYCKHPCLGLNIAQPPFVGGTNLGYRCNTIAIDFDLSAIRSDPEISSRIRVAFRRIALHLESFYADSRILRNYERTGSRLWTTSASESHPVKSWWWRGVPETLGVAVLLGPPYTDLWPALTASAQEVAPRYALIEDPTWSRPASIRVPRSLRVPRPRWELFRKRKIWEYEVPTYAKLWPFSDPFTEPPDAAKTGA